MRFLLIALPLTFVFLSHRALRARGLGIRSSWLAAAGLFGATAAVSTELLSLLGLVDAVAVAVLWGGMVAAAATANARFRAKPAPAHPGGEPL